MKPRLNARIVGNTLAAGALALVVPGVSWASDHLLSVNGATFSQPATVTQAGSITQPLILTNFDPPPAGRTVSLGESQSLTPVFKLVKMCKPGTKNRLEWLDQGNTFVGVTGVLTSGTSSTVPNNGYRLTLTMTGISDAYLSANGPCSVDGQRTYSYTAGAVIEQQTGGSGNYTTKLSSTYNFWNVVNTAPEPETVLLMLTGLLGLAWFHTRRTRAPRRPFA